MAVTKSTTSKSSSSSTARAASSSSPSITKTTLPVAASSTKQGGWLSNLSTIASRIYFFLIILQIPLFKVPCRSGMCMTPIHVTSSQLIASEIFPIAVVKGILYPGAVVNGIVTNMTVPRWDNILSIYNLTDAKQSPALADLQRLEVLAGSYFSVAGAFVGILKAGRMSMFGTLLISWGLVKEGILGKSASTDPAKAIYVYPTMLIAMVLSFSSVKYDAKKLARNAAPPPRPVLKPLDRSTKSKLK